MQTHKLIQGGHEWAAHRAQHLNASDAPAMLGCSPYKTRSELLREIATRLTAEVDPATQRRFDDGHRFEALARPLAEEIIGEALAPVVGSDGELSASFDGLTLMEDTAWEHKSLNDELRNCIPAGDLGAGDTEVGGGLPLHYRVQMEQQCMVAGCERVLFTASKWDGDTLIEERHCWYYPDSELRSKIVAGWRQFATDLANYKPETVAAPVVATPVESLPAVSVRVDGSLAVVSNLPKFGEMLREFIAKMPAKPSTDQEFADTDAACKALKKAEEALEAAEAGALGQIASVEEMTRMVADLRNLARTTRLASEKMVEARKTQIRTEQVHRGKDALAEHIAAMNARLGKPYIPAIAADFAGAIKGKKTVQSLKDGIDTELARTKIEANAIADRIQENLTTLRELAANHAFLFADTPQIVLKANDDLTAMVKSRIAEHEAAEAKRMEAERERIRAEEAAKLEREQAQRAEHDLQVAAHVELEAAMPQPVAYGGQDEFDNWRQGGTPAQAANVVQMRHPVATDNTPPTLKLGQISERLGFTLSGEFLKKLGFEPAARDKAALLFHEWQFPLICMRLVAHINHVQTKQAA